MDLSYLVPLCVSILSLASPLAEPFYKRFTKKSKRQVFIAVFISILIFWSGLFYYKAFIDKECIKTSACVSPDVLSKKDEIKDPIIWNKLMEEYKLNGLWDTSAFSPKSNSLCTNRSTDLSKYMWRFTELSALPKSVGVKFYIVDQRDIKGDPMFFILAFRIKNPETDKYETQISRFSVPVDGKTQRLEVLTYSKDKGHLDFVDNPGALQQPIEVSSQVNITYEPELIGNYMTQFYKVLYNPIGENDGSVPSDLKPYILDSLPFASLNGVLIQMGFGVTVGGCIQDLEYYIEP